MKPATLIKWYQIHKWTSLICTAFILLLCITGLPLIFHDEIDHISGYRTKPPEMQEFHEHINIDKIIKAAKKHQPEDVLQFLSRDLEEPDAWFIRFGKTATASEPSAFLIYDARTGKLLNEYPLNKGIMDFLFRLHYDMFSGLPGTLFLGFMGLLLIASIVSGVVLYGPFMRKLPFGTVRRRRSSVLKWLDLHNLIGIVTLGWLAVVGATGVINTLAIPIFGHWQSTELASMTDAYGKRKPLQKVASTQEVLDSARKAEPDKVLSFMAFPGTSLSTPFHYVAFMQGTKAWSSKLLKPVLVDSESAVVEDSRELPWYVTMLLLSQPLHFGDYGGMPLKILWAALDIFSILLLGSGLYLWIKRHNYLLETLLKT
ncbi:PepSY-associated TM helix domain-containing protein [Methylohalobius crimeensis]|uniref:PepSY-associated TM helix domain-containing protein n=1 Tax=Methylohalobius crimeensis TaxID=244365 RepID=UPI0003B38119|nr:PepSY-associated TM helix domain-containing protein [Methylohalobius crimeensis]